MYHRFLWWIHKLLLLLLLLLLLITFVQGIYDSVLETKRVSSVYNVAAILWLRFCYV
jgi:hypothetical protein